MVLLPHPKKWRKGRELVAIDRDIKVRRPTKGLRRSSHAEQMRMLDRAIADLLAQVAEPPGSKKRKTLKSLDLSILDQVEDGRLLTGPESYQILIDDESIRLVGTDAPALRAGLVTLGQMLSVQNGVSMLPHGELVDWPDLPLRGFHLDLTCQALSFDYVCSLLARMAGLKYNAVLLEWGDKFPYQGHRILSHDDAFSVRQVSQVLELADSLGLVVIPLVQTLAHTEFILRHPQFAHLAEVPGDVYQMAVANPESLVLAKQLVDQLIESHPSSPYIHLGGDEANQLGEGSSADDVSFKGKSLVWVEYMNVISRHVQARGRTPIAWDDMLLAHPHAINRFTRDCLLMHWNYRTTTAVSQDFEQPGLGRINAKTYRKLDPQVRERYEPFWSMNGAKPPKTFFTQAPVAYLQQAGFKVILAGTTRSAGDGYSAPRLRHHTDNCLMLARTAAERKSLGLMVTSWSVRRAPIETTMPALAAAAEAAWNCQAKRTRDMEADLAEVLCRSRKADLLSTLDLIGHEGPIAFNGVNTTSAGAWDRRRGRWAIPPIVGRLRRAELDRLTATSETVQRIRRLGRDAKSALTRLTRAGGDGPHAAMLPAWRYAAREAAHKANQWLFLWQLCRFVRVDRGSAGQLARLANDLIEEIRRCQRDFKRTFAATLTAGGLQDELELHFGGETRLLRRVVRSLRTKAPRIDIRTELAEMLGLSAGQPAAANA